MRDEMSEDSFDTLLFWSLRVGMYVAAVAAAASLAWGFAFGWN
jgi:hypothetical protein